MNMRIDATSYIKGLEDAKKAIERYEQHRADAIRERKKLKEAKDSYRAASAAQKLVQEVAAQVQTQAHERIATVVGRCLSSVFPNDGYGFAIRFDRKRGRTEARMVFLKDGEEVNPIEEDSGGVVDVAAFGLRIACLLLSMPKRRKLLVLDEPFKGVAANNVPAVATLLETLSRELGVQILLVTHCETLQVGKVIKLED